MHSTAMDSQLASFPRFSELPKSIRLKIWRHTANVPRVVEIHEDHNSSYGSGHTVSERNTTRVESKTRPPSLLHTCREARGFGLGEIYDAAYHDCTSKGEYKGSVRIYVNRSNDITYRRKDTCRSGCAFQMRVLDWKVQTRPLAATNTLAVDIMGVTMDRCPDLHTSRHGHFVHARKDGRNPMPLSWERKYRKSVSVPDFDFPMVPECAQQIVDCWKSGLRKVLLVVGNDDDIPEVNLVPLNLAPEQETYRYRQARLAAEALQRATDVLCLQSIASGDCKLDQLPRVTIDVMTVERQPCASFSRFSSLPTEIQTVVWDLALRVPRVIENECGEIFDDRNCIVNRHVPPLLHVSRHSRALALKHLKVLPTEELQHNQPKSHGYYNPMLDVLLLARQGHNIISDTASVERQAVLEDCEVPFDPEYALHSGAKEIVVVGGKRATRGWMTLDVSEDQDVYRDGVDAEMCAAWWFKDELQKGIEEFLSKPKNKWYESNMPLVTMAKLVQVCHTKCPYSYDRVRLEPWQ